MSLEIHHPLKFVRQSKRDMATFAPRRKVICISCQDRADGDASETRQTRKHSNSGIRIPLRRCLTLVEGHELTGHVTS